MKGFRSVSIPHEEVQGVGPGDGIQRAPAPIFRKSLGRRNSCRVVTSNLRGVRYSAMGVNVTRFGMAPAKVREVGKITYTETVAGMIAGRSQRRTSNVVWQRVDDVVGDQIFRVIERFLE